ncbi:hypothetical protein GCM10029964_067660 [Kibdelosporangium lantanae]
MTERLAGKMILVTAGTFGIGEAVARRVVVEGAAVVIGARRAGIGRPLVDRLRAGGAKAVFVPADVSVEADAEALVAVAVAEFGRLDGAVNNAGSVTASGSMQGINAPIGPPTWQQPELGVLRHQTPGSRHAGCRSSWGAPPRSTGERADSRERGHPAVPRDAWRRT